MEDDRAMADLLEATSACDDCETSAAIVMLCHGHADTAVAAGLEARAYVYRVETEIPV